MAMVFKKVRSPKAAVDYLAGDIRQHLQKGQKVLWLVPGGSGMDIAVGIAGRLRGEANLANLTVTLTDERFGAVDHPDSNWRQLKDKQFSLPGACLLPVLDSSSFKQSAQKYGRLLDKELADSDYAVALAGMGADGHILGIKPASPAVNASDYATGYEWTDFDRLTATGELIKKLDEIVVYAVGKEKWRQLDKLSEKLEPADQPAQLLKTAGKVTIFNDHTGDEL